jgi:hypothetical protein
MNDKIVKWLVYIFDCFKWYLLVFLVDYWLMIDAEWRNCSYIHKCWTIETNIQWVEKPLTKVLFDFSTYKKYLLIIDSSNRLNESMLSSIKPFEIIWKENAFQDSVNDYIEEVLLEFGLWKCRSFHQIDVNQIVDLSGFFRNAIEIL